MKRPQEEISGEALLRDLSDRVRLRMLRILEAEELAVGEVASVLRVAQSTVSRQLKVLAVGGWVESRNVGTATLYRMRPADDLAAAARTFWRAARDVVSGTEVEEDRRRLRDVVAARVTDSQAFFGRVAGEWDDLRRRLFGAEFTARGLLALLPTDWVVADLGCGTGNASELLAPNVERVIAIDSSEAMLKAARKRLGAARNVEFRTGAMERLPLKDGSVDATACFLVLHHVEDTGSAVREMQRVLRTGRGGGAALIVDMVEHDRKEFRHTMGHKHLGFRPEAIASAMMEAGFARSRIELLPADPEGRGPTLFAATGWVGEKSLTQRRRARGEESAEKRRRT
jgi:ArsR family transcriptional regulator